MVNVPLSGTNIRLLSGVPFHKDYKNTRWFDTKTQQTNYFLNKPTVYVKPESNFQRVNGGSFVSVNKSVDELWNVNYLMFQNQQYNNKWFYGFVTELEYVQKNTTYVHFQLDVLQTWIFETDFKPSYVVREHCPLWNSDGTPVINTIDEGLDYGKDYDIVSSEKYVPYDTIYFLVAVSKTAFHGGIPPEAHPDGENFFDNEIFPSDNGVPQPLTYYILPIKLNDETPTVSLNGSTINLSRPTEVLKGLFVQEGAVNNIVSLYITEYIGMNMSYDGGTDVLTITHPNVYGCMVSDNNNQNIYMMNVAQQSTYTKKIDSFPNKYDGYRPVKESKLLMYPYTVLTFEDYQGNHAEFKNEYIGTKELEIVTQGGMGTSHKVAYLLNNYNVKENYDTSVNRLGNSIICNNPNDIPIMSDMLSAYLQGNRNSIQNQKNSIMWNGVMGMISGSVSGVGANVQRQSAISKGSTMGATMGALSVAQAGVGVAQGLGNTVLDLQAIQAKQVDISNVPPQISNMGGNTPFTYGNGTSGLYIVKKQIKQEYIDKLTDFFNMYGYRVDRTKIPNFHTRQYWNYVETKNCNILGSINNDVLQELKNIFDNGICLWHTDDIGNYNLENEVI